jgi:hypothetical protein
VFNSEGASISKWGSKASNDEELNVPRELVVDSSGNVYVSDGRDSSVCSVLEACK